MTGQTQHTADSVGGSPHLPSAPHMALGIHYTKSMTFQVFNAPAIFTTFEDRPNVALVVDVRANQLAANQPAFEVELAIRCQGQNTPTIAEEKAAVLFEASLVQAGIFTLQSATQETLEPLLLIEAPRLLFPAARNVLTTMSREAGFLPIIVQQIDFAALWRSRKAQG
ncbi:protein-export chaperone SecB [Acetobacter orientalis]|uniref:protein-export chaperone SecB n=1 Tax=Acetobacter orientalis TaxID=146474 RepID=UPI0039E7FF5A